MVLNIYYKLFMNGYKYMTKKEAAELVQSWMLPKKGRISILKETEETGLKGRVVNNLVLHSYFEVVANDLGELPELGESDVKLFEEIPPTALSDNMNGDFIVLKNKRDQIKIKEVY